MSEARTAIFNMRITPEERQAWKQAALQSGLTMTGWARAMLNANLGSVLTEGEQTELEEAGLGRQPNEPVPVETTVERDLQAKVPSPSVSIERREDRGHDVLLEQARLLASAKAVRVFAPDPKPAGRKKKR